MITLFSAGVAALLVAVLFPAVSEAAQPKTISAVQAQIDQLNEKAEVISERYNGAQIRLAASQRAARTTSAAANKAHAELAAQQARVSAFAAQAYEQGGETSAISVALSGDPGQALTKLSMLEQVNRSQSAVLARARAADQRYRQTMAAAKQATAGAQAITTQLAKQKQQIDALLAQSKQVLAELNAQQQAALLAAQRAKAAAERARTAAALAAAQRQRLAAASRSTVRAPLPSVHLVGGSAVAQHAVAAAMTRLGDPYVWGAAGPTAFDCSGLVQWAYGQAGVRTAHYTGAFWSSYPQVNSNQLRPGDLVFFYADHHHVGMYIGNGMMVEAPHTGDVVKVASVFGHGSYSGAVRVVG